MSPIGHAAAAFPAKRFAPALPLWLLIVATAWLDILYMILAQVGIETQAFAPWSHSLVAGLAWALLWGLVSLGITRKGRLALVLGATVWSHWVFDFIVWNNLPFFNEAPGQLGLGIWTAIGFSMDKAGLNGPSIIATVWDLAFLAAGIVIYRLMGRKRVTS